MFPTFNLPTAIAALPMGPPAAQATRQERFHAWQDRVREPALTGLLSFQLLFIFVVSPLVSGGLLSRLALNVLDMALPVISFFVLTRQSKVRPLILLCLAPLGWIMVAGANHYIGMLLLLASTVAVVQAVVAAPRVTSWRASSACMAAMPPKNELVRIWGRRLLFGR